MATTMKLIAKQTLGSAAASVTFSSIPQTGYSALLLKVSARSAAVGTTLDGGILRFNGDTSAGNYTGRRLYGNGTSAVSDTSGGIPLFNTGATATALTFGVSEVLIPNYAGSTAKSYSVSSNNENNATLGYVAAIASLWSGTAAITSIVISQSAGDNLVTASSFTLYGLY